MNMKKNFKKTLSAFLSVSLLLSVVSTTGVFAATKKTSLTSVTATSDTAVTLKWKKVSSVNGYEIYQKKAGDKYKKAKTISNIKTISCKISKLTSATTYTYKIRTYKTVKNKKQYSSFSSEKSVTTKPTAPTLTSAVEKDNSVTLSWKKVKGVKGYVVYQKTDKGTTKLTTVSAEKTSATLKVKAEDVLTARAYITVSKKNIYSNYAKEITVTKEQEETPVDTPENNYVTEETLEKYINELKELLEKSYITDEKVQEYLKEIKDLFENNYVTKSELEKYFDSLKETVGSGYVTEEKLLEYFQELGLTAGAQGYVDITDSLNIESCYYGYWNGAKLNFEAAQSCYIPVKPGEKYRVTGYSIFDVSLALFFDAEGKIISNTSYLHPKGKKYRNELIVIPEGVSYAAFGSHIQGLPYNNIMLRVRKYQASSTVNPDDVKNVLYGKKMYATGDSLAVGGELYSYVDSITNQFVMSTLNDAEGGTTLAVREGYSNSICERILAMDTTEKYDYILLEGGFNDLIMGVEIGKLTDYCDYGGYYDRTTVIGAMETICHHIVNNYYESKKLFVLGHNCFGFWDKQPKYWDAIKSVLQKWGIPYVDLRAETNLCKRTEVDPIADKYFENGDGLHPTRESYEIFYVPLIRAKLEDL